MKNISILASIAIVLMAATIILNHPGNAFAQTDDNMSMNKTDEYMMKDYVKINGTIDIMNTMFQAISSKINVTLTDAIGTAEQIVGNESKAMFAKADEKYGFMVYSVLLVTPDMKFYKAFVDPGNGQVLLTKEISKMAWIKMMHPDYGSDYDKKKMRGDYKDHGYDKSKW